MSAGRNQCNENTEARISRGQMMIQKKADFEKEIEENTKVAETPRIQIGLNGRHYAAIIDTGANSTVCSQNF